MTELPTADGALGDLIEALREYAKEYIQDRDRYALSHNSAHHVPYIEAIIASKTDWEMWTLIEIKHGFVHVVLKRAKFEKPRWLAKIQILDCKTRPQSLDRPPNISRPQASDLCHSRY